MKRDDSQVVLFYDSDDHGLGLKYFMFGWSWKFGCLYGNKRLCLFNKKTIIWWIRTLVTISGLIIIAQASWVNEGLEEQAVYDAYYLLIYY